MTDAFTGFPAEGLSFLTTLGTRDKAWFDENKPTYQSEVVEPAKAFVVAMGERLEGSFAPAIEAQPKTNGSIAPINNDLRFSPDASPYKDHLMFRFWEGPDKKASAMLMMRLTEHDVGFATGMGFRSVDRWRELIDDDATGKPMADGLKKLSKGRDFTLGGADLKRVPAPYDADHPRADLLRHKSLQARWLEPVPKSISSAKFADWCLARFEKCADIHRWLVEHMV